MTALHGVWITSLVGALLFWLAGYLMARGRSGKTATEQKQKYTQQAEQLLTAVQDRDRLQDELRARSDQVGALEAERDKLKEQDKDLAPRLRAMEEERDNFRQDSTNFTSKIIAMEGERDQYRQEVEQLNSVLTESMKEKDQLKQDLLFMQAKAQEAEQNLEKAQSPQGREPLSQRETTEVEEVTETGTTDQAALVRSEEQRRALQAALAQSQTYQTNLSNKLKNQDEAVAEAHQEIGVMQVELARAKEELQAKSSELALKSKRLTKIEQQLQDGESPFGEMEQTPGGTGIPLTKKTFSILLERTRGLQDDLAAAKERAKELEGDAQRRMKLEQLLSAMKSRLEATENRVMSLEQERDRLTARLRSMNVKPTLPGGFDGP